MNTESKQVCRQWALFIKKAMRIVYKKKVLQNCRTVIHYIHSPTYPIKLKKYVSICPHWSWPILQKCFLKPWPKRELMYAHAHAHSLNTPNKHTCAVADQEPNKTALCYIFSVGPVVQHQFIHIVGILLWFMSIYLLNQLLNTTGSKACHLINILDIFCHPFCHLLDKNNS